MPPMTMIASTMRPPTPLRLSWRMSQIKNATRGSTNTEKKMIDGILTNY